MSANRGWFKRGNVPLHHLPVGSVRVRYDPQNKFRAFVKIAEPNCWRLRARLIWEAHRGPIPTGCVVHHKNRNTLDDDIENLEILTNSKHLKEHRPDFEAKRLSAVKIANKGNQYRCGKTVNHSDETRAKISATLRKKYASGERVDVSAIARAAKRKKRETTCAQ